MPSRSSRIPLSHGSPGTERSLVVHRFGPPGLRPAAYLQAALHADETPGLLVLHYLAELLETAGNDNLILGEIVLVPYANPIGLGQFIHRRHSGSGEFAGGGNFNRNWPILSKKVADAVATELGKDPQQNVEHIRATVKTLVDSHPVDCEFDSLRKALLSFATDCDLVLDLHCDTGDALVHMFTHSDFWPELETLASFLGCKAVFLDKSVGTTFQDSCAAHWLNLKQSHPDVPVPLGCVSATIELRGQSDVNEKLAKKDAHAIFNSLIHRGIISGDLPAKPDPLCEPTKDNALEVLRTPITGVLSYCVELGQQVKTGDLIAWVISPDAQGSSDGKHPIRAGTNGFILATNLMKYAMAGWSIGKIVGTRALRDDQIVEGGAFHPV